MKLIICLLILLSAACTSRSDDLEDGYYVSSPDEKVEFFCPNISYGTAGITGSDCVDMTCRFAGDRRIRSTIILKEAVIMLTHGFNYKLVDCGPKETK
jgi:hypothetical protein